MAVLTLVERGARLTVAPMVAAGLAAIGIAVSMLHLDHLPVTLCVFKAATGIPCMTCGTTRTFGYLARLDLAGALHMNPLATLVALFVFGLAAVQLALWPSGKRLHIRLPPRVNLGFWIALGVLVLANWAYLIRTGA